jgi:hypothetical protein
MKQSAPPVGLQWNLPLVDTPALSIPEQQELALALMALLIQVARQVTTTPNRSQKEGPNESATDL